jgi:putative transposase
VSKRKRHDPEQIVRKLQDADHLLNAGKSVEPVCQVLEVSSAAYHRWRNQYCGMKCEEAKRLKRIRNRKRSFKEAFAQGRTRQGYTAGHSEGKLLSPARS